MPDRLVDVPLESLPFVDEHFVEIAATPDAVWQALLVRLARAGAASRAPGVARRLRSRHTHVSGPVGEIGSTLPGFVVTRAVEPAVLALMGQHRFARYALVFRILEKPSGLVLLSAQTRAEFPGAKGRAYRALVVGSRAHRLVTRRILRAVRYRAEGRSGP
jgi:hypothetical protein